MPDSVGTRKLTILSHDPEPVAQRDNWKLYKITVAGEDGQPVAGEFRTFEGTPDIGVLKEYEVSRRDHEKYGTSFTLSDKSKKGGGGGSGSGLGKSVDELRVRIEAIEARLGMGGQAPATDVPVPQAATAVPSSPATNDDDIPFLWQPVEHYEDLKGHVSRW